MPYPRPAVTVFNDGITAFLAICFPADFKLVVVTLVNCLKILYLYSPSKNYYILPKKLGTLPLTQA